MQTAPFRRLSFRLHDVPAVYRAALFVDKSLLFIKKMQRSIFPASFPRFSQIPNGIAQCDNLRQRMKNRGCKPHCSAVYRSDCTMCQRCIVQPALPVDKSLLFIKKMQRSIFPASFPRLSQIPDDIAQCDNLRQRIENRGCKSHRSAVYRSDCTMC